MRILNTAPHSSLDKLAPMLLTFGGSRDLDRGFLTDLALTEGEGPIEYHKWVKDLCENQRKLVETAREFLHKKDAAKIATKHPREITRYEIGQYALCQYPKNAFRPGPPSKLMPYLQGPWRVTGRTGDVYTLANPSTGLEETVHVKRMQPCVFDETRTDPDLAAYRDDRKFEVEKIVGHQNLEHALKSHWRFLVQWKGCSPVQNSYQPYEHLKKTEALHAYLRKLGKGHLMPKAFQTETDRKKKVKQTREHGIRAEHPATDTQREEEIEPKRVEEQEKEKEKEQEARKATKQAEQTEEPDRGESSERPQRHRRKTRRLIEDETPEATRS